MPTTQIPLAELVEDMELYPRHAVDMAHVQSLVFALESGANLPPIVADKKSKRITDGWHRARAYKRFLGTDAVVDVELVPYRNVNEMTLDAVARNAEHGRKLDAIDRMRSVIMLRNAGYTDKRISLVLKMPEARVEKLTIRVAKGPKSADENVPGTNTITLKRSVGHLAGTTLTKSQADAHAMMPGTSFLLIAKQLSRALTENMLDLTDAKLVAALTELREVLTEAIA